MDIRYYLCVLGLMTVRFDIKRCFSITIDSQDGSTTRSETQVSQGNTTQTPTVIKEALPDTSTERANGSLDFIKLLKSDLLSGYDVSIRPRLDQSNSVEVNLSFRLVSIVDFDTTGQKFSVMGYFHITWRDDVLKWNSTFYGETTSMKLPLSKIWFPQVVIGRTYGGSESIGKVETDRVIVTAHGTVTWTPDGIYRFMCKVSVRNYPFDTQSCELILYVSDEDIASVKLIGHKSVHVENFMENSEWYLLDVFSKTVKKFSINVVEIYIKVKRRADFTVYTMIVPPLTLALLNVFTFLIPIESGEKGGLAVTLFLAYGFFITITRDSLPHNSLQVSFFVIYLAILLILSVFTVIYVIIEYKIYSTVDKRPFVLCWPFRFKTAASKMVSSENDTEEKQKQISLDENVETLTDVLGRIDVVAAVSSAIFIFLVSVIILTLVTQGD